MVSAVDGAETTGANHRFHLQAPVELLAYQPPRVIVHFGRDRLETQRPHLCAGRGGVTKFCIRFGLARLGVKGRVGHEPYLRAAERDECSTRDRVSSRDLFPQRAAPVSAFQSERAVHAARMKTTPGPFIAWPWQR